MSAIQVFFLYYTIGNFTGRQRLVRYSVEVRYWECPLRESLLYCYNDIIIACVCVCVCVYVCGGGGGKSFAPIPEFFLEGVALLCL